MSTFQEKNTVVLRIFLANIVSETLQEANLRFIEENHLLVNQITPFENREVILRYQLSMGR